LYDKFGLGRRKIQFWEDDMKLNISYPKTVEYKSCTATIYLQKHRGKERFEVRYYDLDSSLQRVSFPDDHIATKFADTVIRALSANRENFVTLRGAEAYHYRSAIELLAPTGLCTAETNRPYFPILA
jgi:hypothetical protein